MPKLSAYYICSNCDAQYAKWTGRCLECGKWGSISKNPIVPSPTEQTQVAHSPIATDSLSALDAKTFQRISTNISELDRVLGGGLVPGSLILLGGEPGIGKSTLALQLAAALPHSLYISGEESAQQITLRAQRLGLHTEKKNNNLQIGSGVQVENILATISQHTESRLVIIDSIQTIHTAEVEGSAGNINQVRACTTKLLEAAKKNQ
jgi:DNA repair protein RadA/Sms